MRRNPDQDPCYAPEPHLNLTDWYFNNGPVTIGSRAVVCQCSQTWRRGGGVGGHDLTSRQRSQASSSFSTLVRTCESSVSPNQITSGLRRPSQPLSSHLQRRINTVSTCFLHINAFQAVKRFTTQYRKDANAESNDFLSSLQL